jgi:hypothetical protein
MSATIAAVSNTSKHRTTLQVLAILFTQVMFRQRLSET